MDFILRNQKRSHRSYYHINSLL